MTHRRTVKVVLSPVHAGDKVQSNTVDFVDFQQSRPCWIQLCRQCIPDFIRPSEAEPHPHLTASRRQLWWSYSFRL